MSPVQRTRLLRRRTHRRAFLSVLLTAAAIAAACAPHSATRDAPVSLKPLVLLTRQGCANTPTMRARLEEALTSLDLPAEYDVIDIETLPKRDIRRVYPTPTLLYEGEDVFGLPAPPSPPRGPT